MNSFSRAHRFVKLTSLFLGLLLIGLPAQSQYKFGFSCAVSFKGQDLKDHKGGQYSSASQVRAQELRLAKRANDDLELNLTKGLLDTGVMRDSYRETHGDLKSAFGTFRDNPDIFAAQLIKGSKIQKAGLQGKFYTKIYGEETLLDFKNLREFVDRIPNDQFYLTHENLAAMHKVYGENMMPGVARFGNLLNSVGLTKASDLVWRGGGNYRITETRLWDYGVSAKGLSNITGAFARLSAPGMPFEKVSPADKADFQIKREHPYPVIKWFALSGVKDNPKGGFDFMFSYPSAKIITKGMDMIFDWANTNMDKIKTNEPDAMDPIELAAITQYAMVYLHPYKDGNGRIVKIIRDKILEIFGLPFDLRYADSLGRDLERSLEDFVAEVRFGVFYAVNRLNAIDTKYTKGANSNVTPSVVDAKIGLKLGGFDTRALLKEDRKRISNKPFPSDRSQVYTVGGGGAYINGRYDPAYYKGSATVGLGREIQVLNRGSFSTDTTGTAYVYIPESNTLYPVNDISLGFYGQGGPLFRKRTRTNNYIYRRPNPSLQMAIDNNIAMFKAIEVFKKNPSNPSGLDPQSIIVKPFITSELNPTKNSPFGDLVLQDFQSNLLVDMFSNRLDPARYPEATLARYRGNQDQPNQSGPSRFHLLFHTNKPHEMGAGDVMGVYSLQRAELIKLQQDVLTFSKESQDAVLPLIAEARRDSYIAARSLLKDFPNLLKEIFNSKPGQSRHPKLSGSEEKVNFHKMAKTHDLWKGLYTYAKNQEWYYETYEQGIKEVDQKSMVVIRNIAEGFHIKVLGLATEKQQGMALELIPMLPSILKGVDAEIKASNREKRKINYKNVSNIIGKILIQRKANEFDKEGNRKEDGKSLQRKNFRAFVDKVVNGVLTEYYSTRGMDNAYSRPFIDVYLHVVGFSPQIMKSTTVDPLYNWTLNGKGELKFFPGGVSFLYKVKIGSEAVDSKYSPYTAQYEVVENKWIDPARLVLTRKQFKASEQGLQLFKLDESGKPKRNKENKLAFTDFGKWTSKVIQGAVNLHDTRQMVPPETPVINSRYELVTRNGNKIVENQ